MEPQDIDIDKARELYEYNPETGELIARTDRRNRPKGTVATTKGSRYIRVRIGSRQVSAHRVAWAIYYNSQPPVEIDHKNRDMKDNRISNLRASTPVQNKQNSVGKGYTRLPHGKFQASIKLNGKRIAIGTYDTPEEAHAAYINKKKELHSSFVE